MSYRLIVASAHQTGLPDKSIHLIVTSPPYFGLRSYQGDQAIEWPEVSYSPIAGMPAITIKGCEPGCDHEWVDGKVITKSGSGVEKSTLGTPSGGGSITREAHIRTLERSHFTATQGAYCIHCGGWRGGLGSEPDIESFIGHLVLVLREMYRCLRDDGSLFFNIGSSYATGGGSREYGSYDGSNGRGSAVGGIRKPPKGIRPKNDMLIPARFALAAQADGWIVRSAMPWIKRNGLPDSTEDRPGQAIESVFMLTKQERYYFDMEAVKQPASDNDIRNGRVGAYQNKAIYQNGDGTTPTAKAERDLSMRYLRAADLFFKTWEGMLLDDCGDPMAMVINPKGYSGAHFACFPPELPEMAILAGTSAYGVCAKCGAPYRRCVEREDSTWEMRKLAGATMGGHAHDSNGQYNRGTSTSRKSPVGDYHDMGGRSAITTGWQPTCTCLPHDPIPATVADFFSGSGTTGMVCQWLGRDYIGIDLSDEYHALAHERINTPREKVEDKRAPHPELQRGLFEGIVP